MGLDPVTVAIGGLVMQGVGYMEQQEAREEQEAAANRQAEARERQYAAEAKRAEIQNIRAVRQQIRAQRAAAASIIGRGATTGTLASSGVAGGVASTGSQLAGNLSYMSDIADTQTSMGQASADYAAASLDYGRASGDLAEAQALSGLGQTIFSAGGGFQTIFGGNKPPSENTTPLARTK